MLLLYSSPEKGLDITAIPCRGTYLSSGVVDAKGILAIGFRQEGSAMVLFDVGAESKIVSLAWNLHLWKLRSGPTSLGTKRG